jgi:hypothetical protein
MEKWPWPDKMTGLIREGITVCHAAGGISCLPSLDLYMVV